MRLLVPLALGGVAWLWAADADVERIARATEVFQEIMDTPDKGIPQELLNKAHCVVVIPGLKKGAFIVGAKYGRGFFSCRASGGVGWTGPGAVRIEGGSFGFQLGGSETDVIMLVMNQRGVNRLLSSKFTLGGAAEVAAGPVGRDATAQTDAFMTAEILSWSRSRGLFAGLSLHGATLRQDLDTNAKLYRKRLQNRQIILNGIAPPEAAKPFITVLNKHSSRKS